MAMYIGEAPETDSEDEQYSFNLSYMKVIPILIIRNSIVSRFLLESLADWQ